MILAEEDAALFYRGGIRSAKPQLRRRPRDGRVDDARDDGRARPDAQRVHAPVLGVVREWAGLSVTSRRSRSASTGVALDVVLAERSAPPRRSGGPRPGTPRAPAPTASRSLSRASRISRRRWLDVGENIVALHDASVDSIPARDLRDLSLRGHWCTTFCSSDGGWSQRTHHFESRYDEVSCPGSRSISLVGLASGSSRSASPRMCRVSAIDPIRRSAGPHDSARAYVINRITSTPLAAAAPRASARIATPPTSSGRAAASSNDRSRSEM